MQLPEPQPLAAAAPRRQGSTESRKDEPSRRTAGNRGPAIARREQFEVRWPATLKIRSVREERATRLLHVVGSHRGTAGGPWAESWTEAAGSHLARRESMRVAGCPWRAGRRCEPHPLSWPGDHLWMFDSTERFILKCPVCVRCAICVCDRSSAAFMLVEASRVRTIAASTQFMNSAVPTSKLQARVKCRWRRLRQHSCGQRCTSPCKPKPPPVIRMAASMSAPALLAAAWVAAVQLASVKTGSSSMP